MAILFCNFITFELFTITQAGNSNNFIIFVRIESNNGKNY